MGQLISARRKQPPSETATDGSNSSMCTTESTGSADEDMAISNDDVVPQVLPRGSTINDSKDEETTSDKSSSIISLADKTSTSTEDTKSVNAKSTQTTCVSTETESSNEREDTEEDICTRRLERRRRRREWLKRYEEMTESEWESVTYRSSAGDTASWETWSTRSSFSRSLPTGLSSSFTSASSSNSSRSSWSGDASAKRHHQCSTCSSSVCWKNMMSIEASKSVSLQSLTSDDERSSHTGSVYSNDTAEDIRCMRSLSDYTDSYCRRMHRQRSSNDGDESDGAIPLVMAATDQRPRRRFRIRRRRLKPLGINWRRRYAAYRLMYPLVTWKVTKETPTNTPVPVRDGYKLHIDLSQNESHC